MQEGMRTDYGYEITFRQGSRRAVSVSSRRVAKSEAAAEPATPAAGVNADNKSSAKTSGNMADSADVPSVEKNAGAKSSMVTAKASVDAVRDMKKNVHVKSRREAFIVPACLPSR